MTQDFAPSRFQAQVLPYLANLKSSGPVELGAESAAIVAFPSFHVALALISAFSLGALRRLRVGAWILAALICISTITTGWHYGVDVLGGIAVAAVSVAVAAWISDASADACCSLPVKS
jgi:membrane-associated phospholipid phosphatase